MLSMLISYQSVIFDYSQFLLSLVKILHAIGLVYLIKCVANMKLSNALSIINKIKSRQFFVSTPIFYVNAVPHIGHLYSAVIADAVQRFEKLLDPGCQITFSTGTDEHGAKVERAASIRGVPPVEYCQTISSQYRTLFQDAGIQFTDFVRTTEDRHKKAVQHFWNELMSRGCIYSSNYSGWYCVNDETFLTESNLREETRNGQAIKVSAESGHPVEWTQEQNYMFRLSFFKSDLRHWLKEDDVIQPAKYQNIVRNMISSSEYLPDISISRPINRVSWLIPVPNDPSQGIYVWLDALINYLTVTGYPDMTSSTWPADVHVVGKDILKFHGLYWPAFLMAVGMNPPRKILCHGHWTVEGQKMSKSLNNVVDPYQTLGGLEALRYFLLREGTMPSDANYSETKMIRAVNSQLADTLGNLLARCTGHNLNPRLEFPQLHDEEFRKMRQLEGTAKLIELADNVAAVCHQHYLNFNFYKAIDAVMATLHALNFFFETLKPWEIRKSPERQKELDVVLHLTMETLRICSIILQPVIPALSSRVLDKLLVPVDCRNWDNLASISWQNDLILETRNISNEKSVLFQRIIVDKKLKANASC